LVKETLPSRKKKRGRGERSPEVFWIQFGHVCRGGKGGEEGGSQAGDSLPNGQTSHKAR